MTDNTELTFQDMAWYIADHLGTDRNAIDDWYSRPSLRGELFPLMEAYDAVCMIRQDWERLPTVRRDTPYFGEWYVDTDTGKRNIYLGEDKGWITEPGSAIID